MCTLCHRAMQICIALWRYVIIRRLLLSMRKRHGFEDSLLPVFSCR